MKKKQFLRFLALLLVMSFGISQAKAGSVTINSVTAETVTTEGQTVSQVFDDIITVTVTKVSKNNPGFYSNKGIIRYYENDIMTISCGDSYNITNIEFTMYTEASPGTPSPTGLTGSSKSYTWTGSSKTITFTGTETSAKISSLVVTYDNSSAGGDTYTLTYNWNEGTGSPASYTGSGNITLPSIGTREGYTFSGWNTVIDGSGNSYEPGGTYPLTADATLYAQWTAQYQVSWKVNGNDWVTPSLVNHGAKPTLPTAPTAVDFDGVRQFVGWTNQQNVVSTAPETLFTTSEAAPEITEPVTFYAVFATQTSGAETWEKQTSVPAETAGEYVIVAAGDTQYVMKASIKSDRFDNGTNATIENDIMTSTPNTDEIWTIYKKDGYYRIKNGDYFAGGKDTNNKGVLLTDENADYAKWIITYDNNFIIQNYGRSILSSGSANAFLRNNGGSGWAPYQSNTGSAPTLYKKIGGVTYSDYATEASFTLSSISLTTEEGAKTEYVLGETLDLNHFVVTATYSDNSTQDVTGSATFTPANGTTLNTAGTQPVTASYGGKTTNAIDIEVKWTVTYDANGGEGTMTDPNSPFTADAEVTALSNSFEKAGYTFAGWNTDPEGKGTTYEVGATLPTNANITLYAQWVATVTLKAGTGTITLEEGADPVKTASLTEASMGAGVTLPAAAINVYGWSFAGWTTEEYAESTTAPSTLIPAGAYTPTGHTTLYAVYSRPQGDGNEYVITTDLKPGKYVLGAVKADASATLANNSEIGAITFDSMASWGSYTKITPDENGVISNPDAAAVWTLSGNNTTGYVLKKGDLYLYLKNSTGEKTAGADSEEHKVYVDNQNSTCKDAFLIHPTSTSNNKLMWHSNSGNGYRIYGSSNEASSILHPYIRFYKEKEIYNTKPVTINVERVELSENAISIAIGDTETLTAAVYPENASNRNVTWSSDNQDVATVDNGTITTVNAGVANITVTTEDLDKTATCVVTVKAKLVYDANGGEGTIDAALYDKDATATVASSEGFTREHYHFVGWNTAADGNGTSYSPDDTFKITGLVTLFAQWEINTYTVTYNANEGTGTMNYEDSYDANASVTLRDNEFTREGYRFVKWNTEADGSGDSYSEGGQFNITSDMVLYAQWAERGELTTLFHESFGNNSGSARNWSDNYKDQSGERSVYGDASYTINNAKQNKASGEYKSGLLQSTKNVDAIFEVGPLHLDSYAEGFEVTLGYKWNAASIKGTYITKVYYKPSESSTYTEIPNDTEGATSFVDVKVSLPTEALTDDAYFKVVFNTSNAQAVIDEFEITSKGVKKDPHLSFDAPIYYLSVGDEPLTFSHDSDAETVTYKYNDVADTDDHVSMSYAGGVHTLTANQAHATGETTKVTVTVPATDTYKEATAEFYVKVVPENLELENVSGLITFSCDHAIDLNHEDTNVTAYVVYSDEGSYVLLRKVTGVIPANTGLMLNVPESGTPTIKASTEAGTEPEVNFLKPALKDTMIPHTEEGVVERFVYGKKSGDTEKKFYRLVNNDMRSQGNFAYLEIPVTTVSGSAQAPAQSRRIVFNDATDLDNVFILTNEGKMYNVWGVPVGEDYHGIVIKNGRKILKKD